MQAGGAKGRSGGQGVEGRARRVEAGSWSVCNDYLTGCQPLCVMTAWLAVGEWFEGKRNGTGKQMWAQRAGEYSGDWVHPPSPLNVLCMQVYA